MTKTVKAMTMAVVTDSRITTSSLAASAAAGSGLDPAAPPAIPATATHIPAMKKRPSMMFMLADLAYDLVLQSVGAF